MNDVLSTLLQAVITVAVPILTAFLASFIKAKASQAAAATENGTAAAYITQIADAVSTAVTATSQTYVDTLKANAAFNSDQQKAALQKALEAAQTSLSKSVLEFIESAYGDITAYLTAKIEAEVRNQKVSTATLTVAEIDTTSEVTAVAATTAASVAATITTIVLSQTAAEVQSK